MPHVPHVPHQGNRPDGTCRGIWRHVPMRATRPFRSRILVPQSAGRIAILVRSALWYAIPNRAGGKPDCFPCIQSNTGNHFSPAPAMSRQCIVAFSWQQSFQLPKCHRNVAFQTNRLVGNGIRNVQFEGKVQRDIGGVRLVGC